MDDDNYTTSETPAQASTQPRSVVVVNKNRKNHHNSHLPDQPPTTKTLSLEVAVTKDYTTTASASTSDEPPSIEEVCARIRAFEYDLQETVY